MAGGRLGVTWTGHLGHLSLSKVLVDLGGPGVRACSCVRVCAVKYTYWLNGNSPSRCSFS